MLGGLSHSVGRRMSAIGCPRSVGNCKDRRNAYLLETRCITLLRLAHVTALAASCVGRLSVWSQKLCSFGDSIVCAQVSMHSILLTKHVATGAATVVHTHKHVLHIRQYGTWQACCTPHKSDKEEKCSQSVPCNLARLYTVALHPNALSATLHA